MPLQKMQRSHLNIVAVHICIGEITLSFTIIYLSHAATQSTTIDMQSTIMNMCNQAGLVRFFRRMGCDICRAEAQISISESDKCLIPSSTFQHFSGLSEYVLTYTLLHRTFTHLNSQINTARLWSYVIMDMNNTTRTRTRGDFLMDREDMSECLCSVHQGRSVWKSHNFETICVTE